MNSRQCTKWLAVLTFGGLVWNSEAAYAQSPPKATTFYVDRLQIAGGPADGVAVWVPEMDGTRLVLQGALGVSIEPLRLDHTLYDKSDAALFDGSPLTHQFIAYTTVGVELKDFAYLSVTMPFLMSQKGFATGEPKTVYNDYVFFDSSSLHDLRLEGRLRIGGKPRSVFRLGLRGALFLPTGDEQSYTGETSAWGQFGTAATIRLKKFESTLNLGLTFRPDAHLNAFSVGHEFNFALGLCVFPTERWRFGAEIFGSTGLMQGTRGSEENTPLEASLNLRYLRGLGKLQGWLGLAGGTRLTAGYAPDARIVAMAGIAVPPNSEQLLKPEESSEPRRQEPDTDGDSYPDSTDSCPFTPDDGVRPGDGCPEPKRVDEAPEGSEPQETKVPDVAD